MGWGMSGNMGMKKMRKKFGEDGYASAVCGNERKVGRRVWKEWYRDAL